MNFLNRSRFIFAMETIVNDFTTPFLLFLLQAYIFLINNRLIDFLIFGLPWFIFTSTNTYIVCNTICWHLGYFHIICYYLTLIMKRNCLSIVKSRQFHRTYKSIRKLLLRSNRILVSIHLFNAGFWNKYSAIMFLFYNSFICTLIYETFFVDSDLIIKLILGYMLLIDIAIFSCYILSATFVFKQAGKTLKALNRVYLKIRMPTMARFKVCSNLS